ncbi:MAG: Pyrroline-5-carboxylate reductase [Candidatus Magasanikbacteria bacterium GW2011_GWA2_45_39]|uniref:Pyrroline-5-carboxylate reductase n=2 Tax=Candidatus Magasanikiibacteriota TaxID=1752731 RepID=A0A0G1QH76_9BACT|nr:MAG: Pyrroline-5-carboxylate reductase [Candidatus Magasanikbacteria bacterium GW2011_GWA2_45_39]
MGESCMRQLIAGGCVEPRNVMVSNPNATRLRVLKKQYGVGTSTRNADVLERSEVIILAVKPQSAREVCTSIKETVGDQLFISIMAGVSVDFLQKQLGTKKVVRSMPNTPAQIGQGMVVWYAPRVIQKAERALVEEIFSVLGKTLQVHSEDVIDKATAVSGSGPAYLFYFAECLIDAAQALGLGYKDATLLVRETLAGSSLLLKHSGKNPKILRARVTSKGGTTAAAFEVVEPSAMHVVWEKALKAACQRARQLRLE